MNTRALFTRPSLVSLRQRLRSQIPALVTEAIAIQQIAAPTFHEGSRAHYLCERFKAIGLVDVTQDADGNVLGRLAGKEEGPALLVTAHLDTVFPASTNLAVRRDGERLYGPGIGDNSLGLAGLLTLAAACREWGPRRPIWFAANIGEEGLGNLKGMWAVVRQLQPQLGAVIVLEGGAYGVVIHGGIGVVRHRITVKTGGGHAWSDFGSPSAIHELCKVAAAIAAIQVNPDYRTTFNIGQIEGGTSINTIAAEATCLLDMRSEDPAALDDLAAQVAAIVADADRSPDVSVTSAEIGARPAGGIAANHWLVRVALESLAFVGHRAASETIVRAASTDANVPLSLGIPTVCIGLTEGHNAHRLDEYIELAPLRRGLPHCFLTIAAALEQLP